MARHLIVLDDCLGGGELGSLVGTPIYSNADEADLCLTADEWASLLTRRRQVGWPLHFAEVAHAA